MATTASQAVQFGTGADLARSGAAVQHGERRLHTKGRTRPWKTKTALTDVAELLGAVLAVPFAVLLVGTPIALAIVLLLWLGRLALSGF